MRDTVLEEYSKRLVSGIPVGDADEVPGEDLDGAEMQPGAKPKAGFRNIKDAKASEDVDGDEMDLDGEAI